MEVLCRVWSPDQLAGMVRNEFRSTMREPEIYFGDCAIRIVRCGKTPHKSVSNDLYALSRMVYISSGMET